MSDSLSFCVQKYFNSYMLKQKNYGPNTTASYSTTFSLLLEFLKTVKGKKVDTLTLNDIDKETVIEFIQWLKETRSSSESTCNVRLAHIRSFMNYIMMEIPSCMETCSKVLQIPLQKVPKKPPEALEEEFVRKLLAAPGTKTREGLRHTAMLSLLYDSGCRVQELIDLTVGDLTFGTNARILVRGKGNKYRTIPVLAPTAKLLKVYMDRFSLTSPEMILFPSKNGGKMTRQGVRYIVIKYADEVKKAFPEMKSLDSVHPHTMRHSKATHMVNANIHIFNVRDFLGHESVQTTQIYLTSNLEKKREALEKASATIGITNETSFSKEKANELEDFLKSMK